MAKKYRVGCTLLSIVIVLLFVLMIGYYTRSYTVVFDTKGGTIYPAKTVRLNGKITRPADPIMSGYTFEGWYIGDTDTEYDFKSSVTDNLKITAKWKKI